MKLIKAFPFPIREVQTNNGTEWTTQLLVIYHRIELQPLAITEKQSGSIGWMKNDFTVKCRCTICQTEENSLLNNIKSNNISKNCLKYRSPNAVLEDYLAVM